MNTIYLNFSSKNTVKDSCASVISCKSSSNENASFIAFMTWQQQKSKSHGTTQTNYKLYQYPLLHPVIDEYWVRVRLKFSYVDQTRLVNKESNIRQIEHYFPVGYRSHSQKSRIASACPFRWLIIMQELVHLAPSWSHRITINSLAIRGNNNWPVCLLTTWVPSLWPQYHYDARHLTGLTSQTSSWGWASEARTHWYHYEPTWLAKKPKKKKTAKKLQSGVNHVLSAT